MPAPVLSARHLPSGLDSRCSDHSPPFSRYAAQMRELVHQARSTLGVHDAEHIIAGNAPFESHPEIFTAGRDRAYRRGVLLIHGLSDSPYFMRALGDFFREQGFRVMAVLLPGHGTQPGDLLDVRWQDWAKTVAYGCDCLAAEADELYLGGFSAGGTLGLLHSLGDHRVRGLFLFAPALRISPKAAWAKMYRLYDWLLPGAGWIGILPDDDIYKYESLPKNAAVQMHALARELHRALARRSVDIPLFAAASADDATVDSGETWRFMARSPHPANRLVWYAAGESALPGAISAACVERVDSAVPERHILGSAHTAIVLPEDDPYYGENGAYRNCLHYHPHDMARYAACKSGGATAQGEITPQNLRAGTLRRLMYNPHFPALREAMRHFIGSLP
ncbi:MAG: alpha/beta hydrolase [Gallionella sp.]|nr:alpha/beta hydrolase [Gallionella sp.]